MADPSDIYALDEIADKLNDRYSTIADRIEFSIAVNSPNDQTRLKEIARRIQHPDQG